jgi:transcription termination factor NusB
MLVYSYYNPCADFIANQFENLLTKANIELLLMKQVLSDWETYHQIKKGEDWQQKLIMQFSDARTKLKREIAEWFRVWLIKWRQRTKFVNKKEPVPPDAPKELEISADEKKEILAYIKEALVSHNEIAGIDLVSKAVLKLTLMAMNTNKDRTRNKNFANEVTTTVHAILRSMMESSTQFFCMPINEVSKEIEAYEQREREGENRISPYRSRRRLRYRRQTTKRINGGD